MKIKVIDHGIEKEIQCSFGETLLDAMKRCDIYMPAYCAGRGTCKKCRIRLVEGSLPVTEADQKAFDEHQLAIGMRLSCQARPKEDCTIILCTENEEDFEVLNGSDPSCIHGTGDMQPSDIYGVAIDIGTTTIAMELINLRSRKVCAQDSRINHQRAYGADVISRIQASVDGAGRQLKESICADLLDGIYGLIEQVHIIPDQVTKIVVAANTTMCHLLMGYPCNTLGVSPFTPVNIKTICTQLKDVMGEFSPDLKDCSDEKDVQAVLSPDTPFIILPGISTFVGADIVAGLLVSKVADSEDVSMLIDLGTNGEMAVGNKHRCISTSTAAGPAFEGGNISCGIGSVKGAIYSVEYTNGTMCYKTIANEPPVGICGTGVMDITAELVKHEIVDETGLLDDDYFENGVFIAKSPSGEDISFSQKDVREIQLAKAAVRAGIEVLLKRFGTDAASVSSVYLSGGFGFRLDVDKAISVGLLPEAFRGKIKIAGNTSLAGAKACLLDENVLVHAADLAENTEEISLGDDKDFNEYYMDAMYFEQL